MNKKKKNNRIENRYIWHHLYKNYFKLYGMYTAKLALAVVLAGGVPKCNESGNYASLLFLLSS